tara:strand:- start:1785 stop:2066 length:282 start_codon:yes stop_codon:yes gene_type:complete
MIGKLVAPLLKLLLPKVTEKVADHLAKIFKMDQLLNYMELPNEADKKIEQLEAKIQVLLEDTHPPAVDIKEFEEMKETIKKIKKLRVFKSIGK